MYQKIMLHLVNIEGLFVFGQEGYGEDTDSNTQAQVTTVSGTSLRYHNTL